MKVKKVLFIILGCVGLALGAVGAVLPLLQIGRASCRERVSSPV